MNNEEQKIAELENDPVSKLLGGLKRVEAPGDFDFRVKARIAAGRPVDRNRSWLPATVRLAVPLGLLLLIGGYFGYNSIYSTDNLAVAPVVEIIDPVPATAVMPAEPAAPSANEVVAKSVESRPDIPDGNININKRPSENKTVPRGPAGRSVGGGSVDRASRISNPLRPEDSDRNASVSAKDVLSSVGIDVDPSWKVGSVKQNSPAARAGLKSGDVIEAINDQNLADNSTFGSKFRGKSLRISRDGKSIQINLKP